MSIYVQFNTLSFELNKLAFLILTHFTVVLMGLIVRHVACSPIICLV
jgi:hypothetical protein